MIYIRSADELRICAIHPPRELSVWDTVVVVVVVWGFFGFKKTLGFSFFSFFFFTVWWEYSVVDSWNPTRNPRDRKKKKIKRKKERKKRKEKERKRKKEKKKKSKYKLLLLVLLTSPFPHFRGPGKLRSLYYYHIIPYSRVPRNIIETRKSVTARSSPAQPKPSPSPSPSPPAQRLCIL